MNLNQNNFASFVALATIPNLGFSHWKKLETKFSDINEITQAKTKDLELIGINNKLIQAIKNPDAKLIENCLKWNEQENNHIITLLDDNYPQLLKEIASPPLILFVKGNIKILNSRQIAIVGSRNPSPTGIENAYAFAKELASNFTITSGLALGIDTISHEGAIAAKSKTIAILGTGIDQIYPKSNAALAERIIDYAGALVSEFAIGTKAIACNFPRRNRIISGLSLGTLVIEASLQSGSLITAHFALEQGREIFAIPGSIHNPLAKGCNAIIRQGAKLVETVNDILEEFGSIINVANTDKITENLQNKINATEKIISEKKTAKIKKLDNNQKMLLDCVNFETTPIDLIVNRSGFESKEVVAILLMLELDDLIKSVPGGYVKI